MKLKVADMENVNPPRWLFPKRINTILTMGIFLSLILFPIYAFSGVSADSLEILLLVLAALLLLRLPETQSVIGAIPVALSRFTPRKQVDQGVFLAILTPLCCTLVVISFAGAPVWLRQGALIYEFASVFTVQKLFTIRSVRIAAFIVLAPLIVPIAWILYFDTEIAPVGVESINAVFQTDIKEAWQFVVINTQHQFVSFVFVILVCVAFFFFCSEVIGKWPSSATASIAEQQMLILIIAVLLFCSADDVSFRSARIVSTVKDSVVNFKRERDRFLGNRSLFTSPELVATDVNAPDLVIYIGESTTRHHMGIYGYPRNTTPHLAELLNEIIVYRDVSAPHSNTARALREALTDLNFEGSAGLVSTTPRSDVAAIEPYNIIDLLNAGGYESWWFSNQNQYGIWDNPVTDIAERSQHRKFFRKSFGKNFATAVYDDFMVSEVVNLLGSSQEDDRLAVFIHSYAGHIDYCSNLPEEWRSVFSADWSPGAYFGDRKGNLKLVDCYDSVVQYVDHNINETIRAVQSRSQPTIFLYFSDHGEDVDDGSGHNSEQHSHQHLAVPMIVYFNDAARASYPDMLRTLQRNAELAFETADIYHLLASLAQVKGSYLDTSRAPSSERYEPRVRHVLPRGSHWITLDQDLQQSGMDLRDTFEKAQSRLRGVSRDDMSKLGLHHVNTLAKLREARLLVERVEFDAVFDSQVGRFHVFHPPDPDLGLELDLYLAWAGDLKLWLDLKNLNDFNFTQIFAELSRLDAQYRIKDRLVVEIGSDFLGTQADSAVFRMVREGWTLSLYLPTDRGLACRDPALSATAECRDLEQRIADTVEHFGFDVVSFDSELYPWVRYSAKLSSIPFLTWKFTEILQSSDLKFMQEEIFRKSEIFLVPTESSYASGQFDCCNGAAYH